MNEIFHRTSIRKYQNKSIEDDKIEKIAPLKERMEAVRTVLNVPENLNTFAIIPCGYPEAVHAQQNRFDKQRIHYVL